MSDWRVRRARDLKKKRQFMYEQRQYWELRVRYQDRLWIPIAKYVESKGKTWAYFLGE